MKAGSFRQLNWRRVSAAITVVAAVVVLGYVWSMLASMFWMLLLLFFSFLTTCPEHLQSLVVKVENWLTSGSAKFKAENAAA